MFFGRLFFYIINRYHPSSRVSNAKTVQSRNIHSQQLHHSVSTQTPMSNLARSSNLSDACGKNDAKNVVVISVSFLW